MAYTAFDPGLTNQYMGALLRTINKDGSFNVRRRGFRKFAGSAYLRLITTTWPSFFAILAASYLLVNTLFAFLYEILGNNALHAGERDLGLTVFTRAFFFSVE